MTVSRAPVAPIPISPAAGKSPSYYRIRVTDLVLQARIGVYEHERNGPQRVRINLDLKVAESTVPLGDDIANVLSYEDIVNGVRAIIGRGHINLVETLAEEIASLCLTDPRVAHARIAVDKLDVMPDAAAVGVEIERARGG
jgi:dihydroneopterin aldolase